MATENSDLPVNRLLASLSRADASPLTPSLSIGSFEQGRVLAEPGDETEQIYFPHTGMISLLAIMQDGKAVETATVGNEGVVGAMAGLGLHIALTRAVVQTPLIASHIAAAQFRKLVQASDALQSRDRVDDNIIPLTQELLSEMLGVRRSSVSEVASALQAAGFIRYSRGAIEIVDRKALEGAACECYETIKRQTELALR
jgi:CRP-like cAMP-binding protein